MDLSRVAIRESLKPRREPHWQRVHNGCFLGYRPSKRDGPGSWIARAYDPDQSRYKTKSLGDLGDLAPRDRFTAAKAQAEAFAEKVLSGGYSHERIKTVEQACRAYAAKRPEEEARLERLVYRDEIGRIPIDKVRRHHLWEWRKRLEATPARIGIEELSTGEQKARSPATINRDIVPLRAALMKVLAPGAPGTEAAWQEALRPIKNADRQRTLYLDRKQRQDLVNASTCDAQPFIKALCMLPIRPGAMARMAAADFDARTSELTIGKDKSGRARKVLLPETAAKLIAQQSKDKLPNAPLFMRANGARWTKDNWNKPIKAAAVRSGLPEGITAYTLRHSVLTDLALDGAPILMIAQLSDTSVEMIEEHYGHLRQEMAQRALANLSL
ncbi:MAG: tyrosine-type recombinase/integrase [Erythrobacter sp.]|uniref:tyrosine-type recombinase/integrase n=1 Tax=Erythrobacter sp. TaxID=1042 RepID=UPI0032ED1E50